MKIKVPEPVEFIINTLMEYGYEAYAVGGCVRDTLLGRNPGDWDITTSAKPEEVKKLFRRTIDTGIEHGTVTIMLDKTGYEVTTYRVDGEYEDNRHPKSVAFTSDLIEDLKRRDFTINAMAYNEKDGIVDAFFGLQDLEKQTIRSVGKAEDRFDEDALRMMRAVRFAAQLGFVIEDKTKNAIRDKVSLLKNISAERIRVELVKLITSDHPEQLKVASELGILDIVLPEFNEMLETEQQNPHHIYSVGDHTIESIKALQQVIREKITSMVDSKMYTILCLTMLLHDSGKPKTRTVDTSGRDHFHGHPDISEKIAKKVLKRLKFDNYTIDMVCQLVKYHDNRYEVSAKAMRKAVSKVGLERMPYLFMVQRADILAQNPSTWTDKLERIEKLERIYDEIVLRKDPVCLKDLEVGGKELMEEGFLPGKEMGQVLARLLEHVLEIPEDNKKERLVALAKQWKVQ